jgi:hypothetical protein
MLARAGFSAPVAVGAIGRSVSLRNSRISSGVPWERTGG